MIDPVAPATIHDAHAPPLAGRERERALLREALAAALSGRGRLALLAGEAGIGKTALARDLAREARARDAIVFLGRAYDLSEAAPYGVWLDLLGPAARAGSTDPLESLRAALRPAAGEVAGGQAALFDRAYAALAGLARQRPLVLALDDLHWADPASLDLLRFVARQVAALPILITGTYRADELIEGHPLSKLLPAIVREAEPLRVAVAPLERAAVRQLVRAGYALPESEEERLIGYLQAHAAGNPLYLGELLRTLEEERLLRPDAGARWALGDLARLRVPPLLRQVIAERVGRLGAEASRRLAVAAVIGQEVPLGLWAAIGAVPEDELLALVERATAARVLEALPDGLRVQFHHPLVRQALYEGLSPPRRRAVHQRIGDLLAASTEPDPDSVAYHLRRAGDRRAVAWLVRAGRRAHDSAAWLNAAERLVTAAALLEAEGGFDRERGWLLYCGGRLIHLSDPQQTLRHLEAAEHLAAAAGDRVLATYLRFTRGQSHSLVGRIRRGLAEMEQAVAEMAETLPAEHRLRSERQVALATIEGLLLDQGRAVSVPPAGTRPAPPLNQVNVTNWRGLAGRYGEALALGESFIAALPPALDGADFGDIAPAYLGLGQAYAALGRPAEARRAFALAVAGKLAIRDMFMVDFVLWMELLLVILPYQTELLAERARLAGEAARAWQQAVGTSTAVSHASLTDLLLALPEGRWEDAHRLGQGALGASISGHTHGVSALLGLLARHRGETTAAWARVAELHPAGPDNEPGDCIFAHGIATLALASDLALDAGDLPLAERWIAAHRRWLDWSGAVLWQADQLLLRARHARVAGDLAGARTRAAAAMARATEPRQPLALLAARRLLGELDTAAGREADARAHLTAALALADACAAPYERALTLLALAELHWVAGLYAEVSTALAEARATFVRLGAAPALARADRLAAKLALVRVEPAYPDGLTAREVDVLRLVATGRSNREAAATLAVSERTVERHLENLYRKVGARNRADATAYALRHNLT